MGFRFTLDDIAPLSLGAAVLATGGGGDPYLGSLILRRIMEDGYQPEILNLEEIEDDMHLAVVGGMGSPAVTLEKLQTADAPKLLMENVKDRWGHALDAVVPLEIGGMNSLFPIMCAATGRIPVINGDGMGRAYPTLQRTSFHLAGIAICPLLMVDDHGGCTEIRFADENRIESTARAVTVAAGGRAVTASYRMNGSQARAATIGGTMTLAIRIGRAILNARLHGDDPFSALFSVLAEEDRSCKVLFDGKVVEMERRQEGGWNVGSGTLAGIDEYRGSSVNFRFQNEFLAIRRDHEVVASVPDLISFLDRETAEPVTCEKLRYGQRIKIVTIVSELVFTTSAGLTLTGPQSFGIDCEYRSNE